MVQHVLNEDARLFPWVHGSIDGPDAVSIYIKTGEQTAAGDSVTVPVSQSKRVGLQWMFQCTKMDIKMELIAVNDK